MSSTKSTKKNVVNLPSNKQLEKLVVPYSNDDLTTNEELEEKIKKLMIFFDQYGIDYSKFKPEYISFITNKKAYPNFDQYQNMPSQHNMQKWLYAVKDIHYKQKAGFPYKEAIRQSTKGWQKMEIYDFLNWLKFHEEGAHMKYKFAQVWYENGQPGYFLHVKPDPIPEPKTSIDGQDVNDAREEAVRNEEKRNTIEKQRQKIIGRLDSAEKLLRSPEGQQFAGPELENLMEAIYSLKKKVQLVNKISTSTRLYDDMIVRESNILKRNGFLKAADMLYSIARTPAASAEEAVGTEQNGSIPNTAPPPDPSGAGQSGTMSGLPSTIPGTPNIQTSVDSDQNKQQPSAQDLMGIAPPPSISSEPPQPKGIKEFIENMNKGNKTDNDGVDDNLEVIDFADSLMVTEAQIAPTAVNPRIPAAALEDVPMTDSPAPERNPPTFIPTVKEKQTVDKDEPIEVVDNDTTPIVVDEEVPTGAASFDVQIDNAFQNVTVADVVEKLESISKYYKTREHPRQLSVVDMMLDSLGLASLFPSLSEALNKSLEANNYISTRVDDILAKLRGAIASQEKATTETPIERPEVAGIKGKLQGDQDKENKRKQMRKEQEAAELESNKETPQVEMGELGTTPPAAPTKAPATRPLG